ncbi:MAG: hypothetical protein IPH93_04140 [Saprospiraceae bacterium]|nr:hypothetical protein [Saprospiraceae bacterium]
MNQINLLVLNSKLQKSFLLIVGTLFLVAVSCVDRDFDEPPIKQHEIPFTANSSIAYLKSVHQPGKFVDIVDDITIVATVIADDLSGNFYKTLIVQDSTAGIEIKINRTGLHATFPIGSKIGIKCKGLTVADYAGLIQLGQGSYLDGNNMRLAGIEDVLTDKILFPGPRGQFIIPSSKTINSLSSFDVSTLVKIDQIEFARVGIGLSYANATTQTTVNHILEDCNKNQLLLRTSGFADFAGILIPEKNGSITGVLGRFNSDLQLFIRDTSDVQFDKAPCGGTGGGPVVEKTIREIRSLFQGTASNVSENYKIKGIVISDRATNNLNARNLFIQDASAGIAIRWNANHSFDLGDELEIKLAGLELSEFSGLLQLNNVPLTNAVKLSSGNAISPLNLSISDLISNFENLESSLIRIPNARLTKSSGTTYENNVVLSDKTGSINLFTAFAATFASTNFPTDSVNITAIVSQFNGQQLLLRNLNDVEIIQGGGGTGAVIQSIRNVKNLYQGTKINVSEDWFIKGVVTSEKNALNIVNQNLYIQDASGAVLVRFSAAHSFELGDEIEILVKGMELSEFNNLLQLNNIPLNNAKLNSKNNTVQAREASIKELLDNGETWEGELILIRNVNISKSSGTNYSGTIVLQDGTGTIDCFTRTQASFASQNFPAIASTITGHISQFMNNRQVLLRTDADVKP